MLIENLTNLANKLREKTTIIENDIHNLITQLGELRYQLRTQYFEKLVSEIKNLVVNFVNESDKKLEKSKK